MFAQDGPWIITFVSSVSRVFLLGGDLARMRVLASNTVHERPRPLPKLVLATVTSGRILYKFTQRYRTP